MVQFAEVLIPMTIFTAFYFIIKVFTDYRLKRMLIDRGLVSEGKQMFADKPLSENPLTSFKWGLILVGIGAAILLRELFPFTITEQAMVALMFLFAGISFLIYYTRIKDVTGESMS